MSARRVRGYASSGPASLLSLPPRGPAPGALFAVTSSPPESEVPCGVFPDTSQPAEPSHGSAGKNADVVSASRERGRLPSWAADRSPSPGALAHPCYGDRVPDTYGPDCHMGSPDLELWKPSLVELHLASRVAHDADNTTDAIALQKVCQSNERALAVLAHVHRERAATALRAVRS